jgi:hypothetical protein
MDHGQDEHRKRDKRRIDKKSLVLDCYSRRLSVLAAQSRTDLDQHTRLTFQVSHDWIYVPQSAVVAQVWEKHSRIMGPGEVVKVAMTGVAGISAVTRCAV